jgi:carbon starvation protein
MSLLTVALTCAALFAAAYLLYGRLLSRLFRLNRDAQTPAVELRDDVDYVPIEPKFLLGQHFSAIAAAGPIVGPILAGMMFGWLPALIWIVVGSIFIGGVHDFAALVASVRHKARSIAQIVREQMTRTSYVLFMIFVWIALVYVVVAFTDIVAGSFVGQQTLENGVVVSGGGIASSSMIYLALPIIMGLLLRFTKLTLGWATLIFLPLVGVAIWAGQHIPLDLAGIFGLSPGNAVRLWDVLLLAYCFAASLAPMWILLQPRGHLGGYFLYCALGAGLLGVLFGGHGVEYPAFIGWTTARGETLFPLLFITIACGACSGFHALVASGTSSKQLKRETDARPVGYGAMLLEGMVGVVSVCCLMMLPRNTGITNPNYVYASGIGNFLRIIHIPVALGVSFGLLAFTTFVYDTLDVCTRLGRYILQELTGWQGTLGRWVATAATAMVPLYFVLQKATDAAGKPIPAWKRFWPLFGASNQLLAALTLLAITVWLYRTRRAWWVWPVVGVPSAFMYLMSMWALIGFVKAGFWKPLAELRQAPGDIVSWVALLLVGLSLMLLVEAARVLIRARGEPVVPLAADAAS